MQPSQSNRPAKLRLFFGSVRFRFTVLATISSLVVIAFSFVSFNGLNDLQSANAQLQSTARIVQRHMRADMTRDSIKDDLVDAKAAKAERNPEADDKARSDFAEHLASIRRDLDTNLAEEMPGGITANMRAVKVALQIYISAGEAVLKALKADADPFVAMEIFREKFAFLANANDALSRELLDWAEAAKAVSAAEAYSAELWIAGFAFLALVCSIAMPVYAITSIFSPLRRMQLTMSEIV